MLGKPGCRQHRRSTALREPVAPPIRHMRQALRVCLPVKTVLGCVPADAFALVYVCGCPLRPCMGVCVCTSLPDDLFGAGGVMSPK